MYWRDHIKIFVESKAQLLFIIIIILLRLVWHYDGKFNLFYIMTRTYDIVQM